jgi:large subunit ribosomal protein L31
LIVSRTAASPLALPRLGNEDTMKANIHPTWYPAAVVTCACGNTWTTGATVPTIKTDICSNCHPFFTGEQRIVDTEGQVDRFMKRLQVRDTIRAEAQERAAKASPENLPLAELGLQKRQVTLLNEAGFSTAGDVVRKLESDGEASILDIQGLGRKALLDLKRALRQRGFDLPDAEVAEGEASATAAE